MIELRYLRKSHCRGSCPSSSPDKSIFLPSYSTWRLLTASDVSSRTSVELKQAAA